MPAVSVAQALDEAQQPRPRIGLPTPPATLELIRALIAAGTARKDIASATGLSMSGLAGIIQRNGWQRLDKGIGRGVLPRGQDQPGDSALTAIRHREAARELRERVTALLRDERLGATKTGSLSKAALELSRALTVAIDAERRCLGLDDPRQAGGRSPGVVIVLPAEQSPEDWNRKARSARRELRRRDGPKEIPATVVTVPTAAADCDDYPDLDAEDDEEGET